MDEFMKQTIQAAETFGSFEFGFMKEIALMAETFYASRYFAPTLFVPELPCVVLDPAEYLPRRQPIGFTADEADLANKERSDV